MNFQSGKYVAVAYSDHWYPGQIIDVLGKFLKIKFLHPTTNNKNVFKWPQSEDVQKVENIFIFFFRSRCNAKRS